MMNYQVPADKTIAQIQAAWGIEVRMRAMAEALRTMTEALRTMASSWAPEVGDLFCYRYPSNAGLCIIKTKLQNGITYCPLIGLNGEVFPFDGSQPIGYLPLLNWIAAPPTIIPVPQEAWAEVTWRLELADPSSEDLRTFHLGLSKELRDMVFPA